MQLLRVVERLFGMLQRLPGTLMTALVILFFVRFSRSMLMVFVL